MNCASDLFSVFVHEYSDITFVQKILNNVRKKRPSVMVVTSRAAKSREVESHSTYD